MKLQVTEGAYDGAVILLEPGKFYQEGLPDDVAARVEEELRTDQVFHVAALEPGATDGDQVRNEPPLDTAEGIEWAARETIRRALGAAVTVTPEATT